MFTVTRVSDSRINLTIKGKITGPEMASGLTELLALSEGFEKGVMLYRIEGFKWPAFNALMAEAIRIPKLFGLLKRFGKIALVSDKAWVRRAAAIEGAFFNTTSVAVSLEYDPDADFQSAAVIAKNIVSGIAGHPSAKGKLFNLNIPTQATHSPSELKIVPMGLAQYGNRYEKRQDPGGRDYYWALWEEPAEPPPEMTDITELRKGNVTLSSLQFDMTNHPLTDDMKNWGLMT